MNIPFRLPEPQNRIAREAGDSGSDQKGYQRGPVSVRSEDDFLVVGVRMPPDIPRPAENIEEQNASGDQIRQDER